MKGRPMSEAPRDGTIIIAEHSNVYGDPAGGHYSFDRVAYTDGTLKSWHKPGQPNTLYGEGCFIQWWPVSTPEDQLEKTERTNWNFQPRNGSHGDAIYDAWCSTCIRERPIRENHDHAIANGLGCQIYLRTMAFDIKDPRYPTEWTYDRTTGEPKCTAREPDTGQPAQEPRCTGTKDMFEEI